MNAVRIALMASALGHVMMNQMEEGGETVAGTVIRPDLTGYVKAKSASGSTTKICGDAVSMALVGCTLDEVYSFVSTVVGIEEAELRSKYDASNAGQQRMFLGNLIRGGMSCKDQAKVERIRTAFEAEAPGLRSVVDGRLEEANKARTEAQAQADAERQAALEAKAEERRAAAENAKAERQKLMDDKAAARREKAELLAKEKAAAKEEKAKLDAEAKEIKEAAKIAAQEEKAKLKQEQRELNAARKAELTKAGDIDAIKKREQAA